ncbi:MAG: NUDIX hydrolase [Candidatus Acidiferrales bacterium]|jgi:8-oxo-dGTP pyrophosphatase MutT (NUDIX family)
MKQQWKLVRSENLYTDPWSKVVRKTYNAANGDSDFIVLEKPEFALIAAVDASRNLLLVRQYRHGVDRSYWALPGGFVDAGETPTAAAQRELREETGYTATRVSYVGALHPIPAFLKTMAHIVLCENLKKDPHAVIDTEIECSDIVPLDAVIQKILAGEIHEMQAVAAILLVNQFLRERREPASPSS